MDRFGRRPVLIAGFITSAVGFAVAGVAVLARTLVGFVAGVALLAFGMGFIFLLRLAAAELFPRRSRGRGVAYVQMSATAGAILGPLLLIASGPVSNALGRDPLGLIWLVAPPILLLGALLVARSTESSTIAKNLAEYHPPESLVGGSAADDRLHPRGLVTGMVALAVAQAAMVMAMGVTGAALHHEGHGVTLIGLVMAMHFIGMFGFSWVSGRSADRLGRRATILLGFLVLGAGGLAIAILPNVTAFAVSIMLVGFGWSLAYTAGTVLVADSTPAGRNARYLGNADLVTALLAASASWAGGWYYAKEGLPGLGLIALAMAAVPILLLAGLRERRPAAAPTA